MADIQFMRVNLNEIKFTYILYYVQYYVHIKIIMKPGIFLEWWAIRNQMLPVHAVAISLQL